MYVVEVEDLYKSFGSIKALRGLNAVFPKGICGLIGPNGSGKTTFIHILMGLVRPDRGKAFVLGFDCWRDSVEIRRRIGVLLEDMYFPGHLTVREYIEHIVRIKGGDKRNVLEIAEDIGFKVKRILVLPQGKGNSSQQMGRHGRESLRKCIYIWSKEK